MKFGGVASRLVGASAVEAEAIIRKIPSWQKDILKPDMAVKF
jgi:hypothetical protein